MSGKTGNEAIIGETGAHGGKAYVVLSQECAESLSTTVAQVSTTGSVTLSRMNSAAGGTTETFFLSPDELAVLFATVIPARERAEAAHQEWVNDPSASGRYGMQWE